MTSELKPATFSADGLTIDPTASKGAAGRSWLIKWTVTATNDHTSSALKSPTWIQNYLTSLTIVSQTPKTLKLPRTYLTVGATYSITLHFLGATAITVANFKVSTNSLVRSFSSSTDLRRPHCKPLFLIPETCSGSSSINVADFERSLTYSLREPYTREPTSCQP